jgi:superfamily II DNA/RNA helicase
VCTPYVFSQYSCIFGLTGSVGAEAEKGYLVEHYGAAFFKVPSFLSTCTAATPSAAENLGVSVYDTEAEQQAQVVIRAVESSQSTSQAVPVVIITKSPQQVEAIQKQLASRVGSKGVQTLLQHDRDGNSLKTEWSSVISKATKLAEDSTGYMITVTSFFGGRGIDYKVSEQAVDDAGGLMLIMTDIPENEREWIQWKGRTARQDQRGQYTVILSREDELIQKATTRGEIQPGSQQDRSVIEGLLAIRNEEMVEKLRRYADDVANGKRLNALCDEFYRRAGDQSDHAFHNTAEWPGSQQGRTLRNFFERHQFDATAVRGVRRELGLLRPPPRPAEAVPPWASRRPATPPRNGVGGGGS